jgi:hypothetical protein
MKRLGVSIAGIVVVAACVAPASSLAAIHEIGTTKTPVISPTCPLGVSKANCTIILTRTTAVPSLVNDVYYPTTVTVPGRIVAFTLGLAGVLSKKDISGLNKSFGGVSQVGITVLRRRGKSFQFTVSQAGQIFKVQSFFGHVVQIPLTTTLSVAKGDVVALTVTTWAPLLAINLRPSKAFRYRASRSKSCKSFSVQTAQTKVGQKTNYGCFYDSTRVEFTATEITNPGLS